MAENEEGGEKTEQPTGRRIGEARKEGQVGVSTDLSNVIGMIGAFWALQFIAPYLWDDLLLVTRGSFTSRYTTEILNAQIIKDQAISVMLVLLPEICVVVVAAAFFGAGCTLIQTNFLWSWHLVKPKMVHINPLSGIKRIFSANNAIHLLKDIAKLSIIGPIGYFAFFDFLPQFIGLINEKVSGLLPFAAMAMTEIFWKIMTLLIILAILDLIYQKWSVKKKLMMTKHEVKDERKAVEGDEGTRRRILSIGMRRIRERMMQQVKTADVVVTNPTHVAVALSYSRDMGSAPRVVAKGRGHLAERIKQIAREHGVPVIERKTLARALFKMAEVGQEIPYELYRAVAEILAYVYRLKGKVPDKARAAMHKKRQPGQTS
jgi:flagellar biosynthesis protein FlhB